MWKEVTEKQGGVLTDFTFKNHPNWIAICHAVDGLSLEKDTLRKKLIQRDYRVQNSFFPPNNLIREIVPWITTQSETPHGVT